MAHIVKLSLIIKYVVFLVLLIVCVHEGVTQDWRGLFMAGQAFVFSLIPTILKRLYGIRTPHILQAGVVIFMFATLFLGEEANFYERFWWWDLLFHMLAGFAFGLIAYIVLILTYQKYHAHSTPALFTSIFAVAFSLAISSVWEIIEYVTDMAFSTNMQPSAEDTMEDLIIGLLGALLSALYGFRYREHKKNNGINGIIDDGVVNNKN